MLLDQFDLFIAEISQHKVYMKLMQTSIHLRKEAMRRFLMVPGATEKSIETRTALIIAMKSGDPQLVTKRSISTSNRPRNLTMSLRASGVKI